jgi:hypothetical protein
LTPETLNRETLENTGEGIGNNFLNRTPIAQEIRVRIDKLNLTVSN